MLRPAYVELQFSRARGLSSWAIARWGVAEPEFSHVDIRLAAGMLLGARDNSVGGHPPGVWVRPPNYEGWVRKAIVRIPCSEYARIVADEWALGERGKRYDEDAIFGMILGQRWHKNGSWICSALAATYLYKAWAVKSLLMPAQEISPNILFAMAGAAGGVVV